MNLSGLIEWRGGKKPIKSQELPQPINSEKCEHRLRTSGNLVDEVMAWSQLYLRAYEFFEGLKAYLRPKCNQTPLKYPLPIAKFLQN